MAAASLPNNAAASLERMMATASNIIDGVPANWPSIFKSEPLASFTSPIFAAIIFAFAPAAATACLTASMLAASDPSAINTPTARAVGVLIADGSDAASIDAVKQAVAAAGAKAKIIAAKIGEVKLANGSLLKIDGQLAGTPSIMFDAVAIILSNEAAALLGKEASAIDFVRDAFGHLKAIGVDQGALLKTAAIEQDGGVIAIDTLDRFIAAAKTRQWDREASIRTLA